MRASLLCLGLVLGLLLGLAQPAAPVQADTQKNAETKKKDDTPPPKDVLPICDKWNLKPLQELGQIISTSNELKTKNQVVWIIKMDKVVTPKMVADFSDEESALDSQPLKFEVLKKEKPNDKTTPVRVTVQLPPKKLHRDIKIVYVYKVVPRP